MTALISRAIPFLSKYIPFNIASKGLKKIDPRFGNFIESSVASGYTANEIMDFIREKIGHPEKDALESKKSLRPDEKASLERLRQQERPIKALQGAASLGLGVAGGLLGMGMGDEQGDAIAPDEILPAQNQIGFQSPNQIGNQPQQSLPSPEQAGYEQQAPIPNGPIEMGASKNAMMKAQKQQPKQPTMSEQQHGSMQALDAAIKMIDSSAIGQYIRKAIQSGADPMTISAQIAGRKPTEASQLEQMAGMGIDELIQEYVSRLTGKQNQSSEKQMSQGMANLMQVLQMTQQARQKRQ